MNTIKIYLLENPRPKGKTILSKILRSNRGHDFDYEPYYGFSDKWGSKGMFRHCGMQHPNDPKLEIDVVDVNNSRCLRLLKNKKCYQLFNRDFKGRTTSPVIFKEIKKGAKLPYENFLVHNYVSVEDFDKTGWLAQACLQRKFKTGMLFEAPLPRGYFQTVLEWRYFRTHKKHSPVYLEHKNKKVA